MLRCSAESISSNSDRAVKKTEEHTRNSQMDYTVTTLPNLTMVPGQYGDAWLDT